MSHDDKLQRAVLAELRWEPSITAAHIGVEASHGTVTLSGHVDSYGQKHAAELAAGRVKGVKAIAEEIEVRLPSSGIRDDADIAAAAINRLAWDSTTPKNAVTVTVEDGWMTLTGEVDRQYQKDAAAVEVRHLMGVTGVSNQITVKPHADTKHLQDEIHNALHRSVFAKPENIHVSAKGGEITLTGTVDSWLDRQKAQWTAWATPGTTAVENDLVVE